MANNADHDKLRFQPASAPWCKQDVVSNKTARFSTILEKGDIPYILQPLHRLPNGHWIELTMVSAITPSANIFHISGNTRSGETNYITTVVCDGVYIALPFQSRGDAEAYADKLAELVNAARADIREAIRSKSRV